MEVAAPPVDVLPAVPFVDEPANVVPEPAWLALPALDVPPSSSVLLVGLEEQPAMLPLTNAETKTNWMKDFMNATMSMSRC
jgi:hypothetical protein